MRRPVLVALAVALVVALAFVGGVYFAGGFQRDPDPPCEESETATPDGDGCVDQGTVCHAYGQVVRGQTVACVARSDDGRGVLRPLLAGRGRVDVTVSDASGNVLFSQAYSLERGSPGDVPIRGPEGGWELKVRFTDVTGDVNVVLWG